MSETKPRSRARDGVMWEAIIWLAVAAFAFWAAQPFNKPLPYFAPGAAFWPKVVMALITISGLVLLISRFLPQSRREEEELAYLDEMPDDIPGTTWKTVAIFVLPVIWTFAMHKMGFLIPTPFFILAFTWLMGVRKWTTLIGFSVSFYALLVLVFYKIIFTSLPMGAGVFHTITGEFLGLIQ